MYSIRYFAAATAVLVATTPAGATTFAPRALHVSAPVRAHATGSLTVLHTFSGTDGSAPSGALDLALSYSNNKLVRTAYGETSGGGTTDSGVVFTDVLGGGPFAVAHSFAGATEGANPASGLQNNASDYFAAGNSQLGVNVLGGTYGFGTLFVTAASGAVTVVHQFTGGADGSNPNGRITEFTDGNFYGTTSAGAAGYGTVFRVTPQGSFSTIYTFTGGTDGGSPLAGLSPRAYKNGNTVRFSPDPVKAALERARFFASKQYISSYLYGVTTEGGANGAGTIFRLLPSGSSFSTVYSFTGGNDGASPQGELQADTAGNLYGVANGGGSGGNGTVFALNTSNALKVLYDFTTGGNGAAPTAPLTIAFNGDLYGTTSSGGANGFGSVFRIAGSTFSDIHDFAYSDGATPNGKLLDGLDGNLYGTTNGGGSTGDGVLFSIGE